MQCDLPVIHPPVGLLLGCSISDGDAVNPRRHHKRAHSNRLCDAQYHYHLCILSLIGKRPPLQILTLMLINPDLAIAALIAQIL